MTTPLPGFCFFICTMGTWPCLGVTLLVLGQGDQSTNGHVTEHGQVTRMGKPPGHRGMADFIKPSAPKLLGSCWALSMVLVEACSLKSRALMEASRGRTAVRFSKGPTDFPGGPWRIILNKEKTVNDRVFCGKSSIPLLEKAMAPHSSTLAWKIPWMEEPGGLQSMGWQRVGHD